MEITYSLDQIDSAVKFLLENTRSRTLLFYGEMGAGKTTLIRSLVSALGSKDQASSPTFSLVNEYSSPKGPIFHFDFYRIKDESEAMDMGIEDYLGTDTWNLIEWPQKIEKIIDAPHQKLELTLANEGRRKLKFC